MYYIKLFFLYSVFGFIMESTLYKIVKASKYSSIFYGPVTTVYGIGVIAIELLNKYVFSKISGSKIKKIIIEYIVLTFVLSLIEYIGGNTLHLLFHIDLWNYSKKFMHIGKYVCMFNSLIWGLLGILYIYLFKKSTDRILLVINNSDTYVFLMIFILDLISVLITKL